MTGFWSNLSERERRIAALTGALVLVCAAVLIVQGALGRLESQKRRIGQLEQHLLTLVEQDARRYGVESAFAKVASQHSSAWTEQEIHDRLRREIYRLALINPHPEGRPPASIKETDYLVSIPILREGTLSEERDDYREYQIRFQTKLTSIKRVITFLERLEQSTQSLRIDELEIARDPASPWVTPTFTVTRTVVDGVEESVGKGPVQLLANNSFDEWSDDVTQCVNWTAEGSIPGRSFAYSTGEGYALRVETEGGAGACYQEVQLTAGEHYRLQIDVTATGEGVIGVVDAADGRLYEGAQQLIGDGATYHYDLRFSVPSHPSGVRTLHVPFIALETPDTVVYMDNAHLTYSSPWVGQAVGGS